MSQANDDFNVRMLRDVLGFGDYFTEAYLKGKASRTPEIPFEPGKLDFSGASLIVLPKVVERPELGDGFYVIKGYQGTLTRDGQEPVSQFFQVYKTVGFNVDQAYELLNGRAVRHVASYQSNEPQFSYSQINFQEKTENGNYKMMRRKADDDGLFRMLGTIGVIGRQNEKEAIFAKLQEGAKVPVVVRRGDDFPKMFIQAAVRKSGVGIDLSDQSGKIVKQYPELSPRQMQPLKVVEPVKEVSPATAKIVAGKGESERKEKGNKLAV